jgi:cytochrome b subunit of formate dehydrogenase
MIFIFGCPVLSVGWFLHQFPKITHKGEFVYRSYHQRTQNFQQKMLSHPMYTGKVKPTRSIDKEEISKAPDAVYYPT